MARRRLRLRRHRHRSGFGGSVTALRLTEKGLPRGRPRKRRRWNPDELPQVQLARAPIAMDAPPRMTGAQAARALPRQVLLFSASGVGGGSSSTATALTNPLDNFFNDPQLVAYKHRLEIQLALLRTRPKRMLGVAPNPLMTPADDVLKSVAETWVSATHSI